MNDLERVWIDESFELFRRQFGDEPLRVPVILPTREFFPPPPPATEADVRQLVRKIAGYMGVGPAVMVEFSWDRERITQLRRHLDAPLSRIGGNAVADRGSTVLPAGFSHPHASERPGRLPRRA